MVSHRDQNSVPSTSFFSNYLTQKTEQANILKVKQNSNKDVITYISMYVMHIS